jgi:O-antigen/teichoic acid export membrane protein
VRRVALKILQPLQAGFVRIIGSSLQLILSLVLVHVAGAALLGRFLVFVAIANLSTSIGAGLPNLMMRYASTASTDRPEQVGWLWRQSIELSLLCGLAAAIFAANGNPFLRDAGIAVGGLLVQRMSSAALKANGHPNLGVLLDTASYPLIVLISILLLYAENGFISIDSLRLSYVAALWSATLVAVVLTWRSHNSIQSAWSAPWRTSKAMYTEMGTVSVGAVANVVTANSALALAPVFLSDAETGKLGLALRVAGFASTILVSLSAYFGPAFARADSKKELLRLRRRSQYACLALYIPVPIALLAFPTGWLERIGSGLGSVKVLVLILSIGFFVNAATGLAPTLLLMRGWSRVFSGTSVVTAILTVGALAFGGKLWGAIGMVAGSSAAMVGTNVWVFSLSSKYLAAMGDTAAEASGTATVTIPSVPRPGGAGRPKPDP